MPPFIPTYTRDRGGVERRQAGLEGGDESVPAKQGAAAITAIVCTCVVGVLIIIGLGFYIHRRRSAIISSRKTLGCTKRAHDTTRKSNGDAQIRDFLGEKHNHTKADVISISTSDTAHETDAASVCTVETSESHFRAYMMRVSMYNAEGPDLQQMETIGDIAIKEGKEPEVEEIFEYPTVDEVTDSKPQYINAFVVEEEDNYPCMVEDQQIGLNTNATTFSMLCAEEVVSTADATVDTVEICEERDVQLKSNAESISDTITLCTMETDEADQKADAISVVSMGTEETDSASIRTMDVEKEEYDNYQLELQMSHSFQVKPMVQRLSMIG